MSGFVVTLLQFDPVSRLATVADWQGYLQKLGITTKLAVKLVTEAALLGSAVEHGLSPELIILSDGARQFDLLVHAPKKNSDIMDKPLNPPLFWCHRQLCR